MPDAFDPAFVEAYSKSTGKKQTIPAAWLDHEVLGADFSLTPSAKARELVDVDLGFPDEAWTPAQIRFYARKHDIAVTGIRRKADLLDAVRTSSTTPTDTTTDQPSTDETPAPGDEE